MPACSRTGARQAVRAVGNFLFPGLHSFQYLAIAQGPQGLLG